MSTSDTTIRNSLRASTFLNRPKTAPMGPRTRKSRSNLVVESLLDTSKSLSSTLDLHEFGGRSSSRPASLTPPSSFSLASAPSSPTSPSFISDRMSIPALSEEPKSPLVSIPDEEEETHSLHTSHSEDSSAKVSAVASTPPKLMPPPGIKFESIPVPWKALPLEAALWMLDSNELQDIVARAIQSSDSFVRLVTLENIDNVLPAELKRLDALKSVTQSKYRFLVHRRSMLFQALNSSLIGAKLKNGDVASVIGGLASQLADTIAECEKLSEELLTISDQTAQINKLIDIHLGSAFAVALRKLNGSLARRVTELAEAKERITQLEIDVQEAWKEAEKMANELDDYETELIADDIEAVIEVAEIVSIQSSSPSNIRRPSTPKLLSIASPIDQPMSPTAPPRSAVASQFGFSPPVVHLKEKENEAEDVPDTVSIRSSHSTRSAKSVRRGEMSRASSVQAAKRRSHRASQSSLRLSGVHSRKQSIARLQSPQEEQPPVPELPLQFTDNAMPPLTPYASSTLLVLDSRSPSLHRKGSLDTVYTFRSPATSAAELAFRGRSADDMYVRPYNTSSSEIQLVRRSQVYNFTSPKNEVTSVFETDTICDIASNVPTSKSIPSMWTNVDAFKVTLPLSSPSSPQDQTHFRLPPTAPESHENSMKTTYSKLKTLTKRYSASLPIFNHRVTRPRPKSD